MNSYYVSGTPFSWKVWLSLEQEEFRYNHKILRVDAGDLQASRLLAVNPRGKSPAIVHDGFKLYESPAIIEYLEDDFPGSGKPLWPRNKHKRAIGRRMANEAENYLYPQVRRMVDELLLRQDGSLDNNVIAEAKETIKLNLDMFSHNLNGNFLLGDQSSVADFTLYPLTVMILRLSARCPDYGLSSIIPASITN
ncbi:MAG: glutathione S-transferase family protein [Alphaproteobacteria bacterium]|nr:glutathione S-transferase family protein [Alphaproteobacteria bacterium]